ncbi:MAG: hypothetical protein GY788_00260 [bacterium]|nr:hypothetical protein [bacterium]
MDAFTAAAFAYAGASLLAGLEYIGADWYVQVAAGGAFQGTTNELSGGSFVEGFIAGAVAAGSQYLGGSVFKGESGGAIAGRVALASAAGGVTSKVLGGKFENGAITAAFTALYMEYASGSFDGAANDNGPDPELLTTDETEYVQEAQSGPRVPKVAFGPGSRAFREGCTPASSACYGPTRGDYNRPSGHRKGVREQVWDDAIEPSTGRVRDPGTGRFMSPNNPWDMGHRPGYEFRKHQSSAGQRGSDRRQFLNEYNNPSHYRPELPHSNRSHRYENTTDQYYGP